VKENYVYTFLAIVNYNLGKPIQFKEQTVIEALTGLGDISENQFVLSDESDHFLYLISLLYLLTNQTSAPLNTPPPRLADVLDLLNGKTRELSSKNIYSNPPLRISASGTGSKRRAHSEPEASKKSRTVYLD